MAWAGILNSCTTTSTAISQDGYAHIAAGEYTVGEKNHLVNPKRTITLQAFDIGIHEVTNREFAAFVEATGHVTAAERHHNAMVFYPGLDEFQWHPDSTASWRHPNGVTRGGIENKMDHPVTCISFGDIQAYCTWAGVRLPTLDEWEVAARSGARSHYFWGNKGDSLARYANYWHGKDHLQSDSGDTWQYTSPVGTFAPNPNGLYDVYGNVFEFCADVPEFFEDRARIACARGGSWWCSFNSCRFFNNADIGRVFQGASFSNQGFRVVREIGK
jgi:formylglycine-generating enzyme